MVRRLKLEEYTAKNRITLEELAGHDDVCSDVLIDNAYYKARIRKNKPKHIPVRGIREDEIPQILLHQVIVRKDVVAAEKAIMKLSGLVRYYKGLRNKQKQDNFLNHLRKYIYMYQTECPFEVSTTNRYTITTYEAAVTARRRIKQGEYIKYLTGTLVPLTTEESLNLDLTNRNFSIVVTGRKKSDQMFLGPARFANHDCDSNARLIMKGTESMEVIAVKSIDVGEEITVSYGDNYFGPNNVECLCHTCEVLERNGWTSKAAVTEPEAGSATPVLDVKRSSQVESKKRKRDPFGMPPKAKPSTLKRLKTLASPSKLQYSWTPPSTSESELARDDAGDAMETEKPSMPSPDCTDVRDAASVTPQRDGKGRFISSISPRSKSAAARLRAQKRKSFPPTPSSTSSSSQDSEQDAAIETNSLPQAQVPVTIKLEVIEKMTLETDPDSLVQERVMYDGDEAGAQEVETVIHHPTSSSSAPEDFQDPLSSPPQTVATLTMTRISTILDQPPIEAAQNSDPLTITALPAPAIIPSIEPLTTQTKSRTTVSLTVTPVVDTIRVPGDYVLTRKLLAQPHDRWVRCHNEKCVSFFLQPNGYQTRRECPRCERHSMLYGFLWPKTDPDARKLLGREKEKKIAASTPGVINNRAASTNSKYSAYRRQGRSGKGTWVEGGGDEEERVMDHRTIHRFVLPDEERELTRKGLLVEAEEARKLGDGWQALAKLDGRAERFRNGEGRESTGRESSEGRRASMGLGLEEGEDDEGRRRSNRIVESRVYVNVDMKR